MEPFVGYVAAGVACLFVVILICFWNRHRLKPVTDRIIRFLQSTWKYLLYTNVIAQHQRFGPWTAAEVLLYLAYISANVICTLYPRISVADLSRQAGTAAFINIAFLYCSLNVDFLAELLGITPKIWQRVHRAVAWMVGTLATLHVSSALSQGSATPPGRAGHIGSILGFVVIWTMLVASINPLKWLTRGLDTKFHLLLALVAIVAIYFHVTIEIGASWKIFIIPVCFIVVLLRDSWSFLHNNGFFGVRWTRASFIRLADNTTQINVYPGRPVSVYPGQYIKLWIPFSGQCSWSHFRQYHVQSCETTAQRQMKLFDLPHGFISRTPQIERMQYVQENRPRLAFFTGPYGLHHTYTQYETLFVVIYDYGILSVNAQLRYIYQCIEGRTSKARRVRVVWQWDNVSKTVYDIPDIDALEVEIRRELDEFSKETKLPLNLIEYHLGRYVPHGQKEASDDYRSQDEGINLNKMDIERTELERKTLEQIVYDENKDSETTKRRKEGLKLRFDQLQNQIAPLENRIGEWAAQKRILDDVLRWMNTTLKRTHEKFTIQCSVYRKDATTSYESGRAEIVRGTADIRSIFSQEIAAHRDRIAEDLAENRGKFLLMVSGPPWVHQLARSIVGAHLDDVDLKEFQYIPGHMF